MTNTCVSSDVLSQRDYWIFWFLFVPQNKHRVLLQLGPNPVFIKFLKFWYNFSVFIFFWHCVLYNAPLCYTFISIGQGFSGTNSSIIVMFTLPFLVLKSSFIKEKLCSLIILKVSNARILNLLTPTVYCLDFFKKIS